MTKFFNNYLFLLCVAFGALFFSSCSKDDDAENDNGGVVINPDKNIPDPKGTITLNMMVGDDNDKSVSINDFGTIKINSAYNFEGSSCSFVSLGKMKGLGNVTAIPQDGWNSYVAVNPGEGYVVRHEIYDSYSYQYKYSYARLYVVSAIAGTSGGVIGYTIKCQAPFVPFAPKFTESSLEFGADEVYTSQKLTLVNLTSVRVKSQPNWCRVHGTENGFYVSVYGNSMDAERSGIIEFENAEGSTSVSVKQQKKSDNPEF
ncbi:DUF5036 family protein [Leyella stercorea]